MRAHTGLPLVRGYFRGIDWNYECKFVSMVLYLIFKKYNPHCMISACTVARMEKTMFVCILCYLKHG